VTFVPQSSPPHSSLPASFCLGLLLAGSLAAQGRVRLAQDTPFLKDPGGIVLATLSAGTRVTPGRASGGFVEVTLQGWIFTASTRPDAREGFELSASGPENIRAEPDGAVLARTVTGTLLSRVSKRGGWTQVRRTGWVQRSLLTPPAVAAAAAPPPAAKSVVSQPDSARKPEPPLTANRSPLTGNEPPLTANRSPLTVERRVQLRQGAELSRAPDGIALAKLGSPAEATVEDQTGDWVKVRVDAWVKRSGIEGPLAPPPAITAAMLRENPERYVGQTVAWRVQFLAHQQADELRPEMPSGRPYLLARGPLPESGFVYVLLSKDQAAQLQGLLPLDELSLVVTVRAARTRYLATPVVELVKVQGGK
jgi:hypothetical protein